MLCEVAIEESFEGICCGNWTRVARRGGLEERLEGGCGFARVCWGRIRGIEKRRVLAKSSGNHPDGNPDRSISILAQTAPVDPLALTQWRQPLIRFLVSFMPWLSRICIRVPSFL
jgi:hypothetical protein